MPEPLPPTSVTMVDPVSGVARDVPLSQAQAFVDRGWRSESQTERGVRVGQEVRDDLYGGAGGTAKAIGAGLARGATLGLSDVAARALGGEDTGIELEGLREVNPGASFASEFAGALAPSLLSGGTGAAAYLPSSLAARAGAGAARLAGGGLRGALAAGAVEGALYGAGEGLTQTALSDDPLDLERAASTIGINTLMGAGVGAGASGLTHGVARGLAEAKGALDGWLDKQAAARAAREIPTSAITAETDVALLDRKGLAEAERQEIARLGDELQPMRERFVEDLNSAHQARESAKDWLAGTASRNEDKYAREKAKVLLSTDIKIRNVLDNRAGLVENPARAKDLLQRESEALDYLIKRGRSEVEAFRAAVDDAPRAIREDLLANKYADEGFRFGKGAISPNSPVVDDITARLVAEKFPRNPDGTLIWPKELTGFDQLGQMRGRNLDLLNMVSNLEHLKANPRSDKLSAIEAARDALSRGPEPKSGAAAVLEAVAPFAGPVGALAAGTKAIAKLRNAAGVVAEKSGKAVSRFLGTAAPAVEAAERYAPPVATKVLAAVRFSAKKRDDEPDDLAGLYAARSKELRELTEYTPDGSVQMRPAQRIKLADKLDGIRAVDPITADRIETKAAAKIEWLSKQLPRRPDIGGAGIGPDNWRPSDLEMRSWARKVHAADDPLGVFERALHGAVTPEDVQAMTAVHPEMLRDWGNQVSTQLPALRTRLSHQKRLALSMLTGIPVEPAMHPQVLAVLQGQFTDEPGSEGGTQAPRAQPAFGSVSKSIDVATPAQARQENHT
jgi:hypothetical protein